MEHHLRPRDFVRYYEGYLSVEQIAQFDYMWWLQVTTPKNLETFRYGTFSGPAREMPPIIVITAPINCACQTAIADGRGLSAKP
jgi:hypothetical protein